MEIPLDQNIIYEFMNTLAVSMDIQGKTRNFGTAIPLNKTEIHLICLVAKNPGIHKIGLAKQLNITKGAVTQLAKKLQKAQLIRHEIDPKNLSRHCLFVTPQGACACEKHDQFHRVINGALLSKVQELSPQSKGEILNFLKSIQVDLEDLKDQF